LLSKLRSGDLKSKRAARKAARTEQQSDRSTTNGSVRAPSPNGSLPTSPTTFEQEDLGDVARGLLQQLQVR
jgi:hypothetical protein